MKVFSLTGLVALLLPLISFAQEGLEEYITAIFDFLGTTVIVFLFSIAFLIFVVNIVRYFIIDGANEQTRAEARMYAIYALFAFVILIVFWGIVNMIAGSLGLSGCTPVSSDYVGGDLGGTDCYTPPPSAQTNTQLPPPPPPVDDSLPGYDPNPFD